MLSTRGSKELAETPRFPTSSKIVSEVYIKENRDVEYREGGLCACSCTMLF